MAPLLIRSVFSRKTLFYLTSGTLVATGGGYYYLNSGPSYSPTTEKTRRPPPPWIPPSRNEMLNELRRWDAFSKAKGKASNADVEGEDGEEGEFDLLIVGGGATGAGVAVDAATRGLRVALVERDDFGSGTSSKSTKLVHGGVRYLQKAVFELDYDQYKLVREALHERRIFLHTAPYLSAMLPIMLPIYQYWQVPYYWAGCKLYDLLAGKENMETSYLMSKGKALETFPMLKSDGLVGAVVYYDGQHNDSRMNIALVMTAVKHGAVAANYCEVTSLHKNDSGKLVGARLRDTLTGKEWDVRCKGIINATGPYADTLLSMDNPTHKPIVQPSSGVHITLPNYYSPRKMGLLDPATSDGRVIFFLPWQGNTIAGTTDTPVTVGREEPRATEDEIRWVLDEVRRYLSPDIRVRRGDVLSAWSGLRPLVRNPNFSEGNGATQGLVRSHVVHTSPSGLVTIAGGKWTTYRKMAEECVDEAVKVFGLKEKVRTWGKGEEGRGCVTEDVRLVGSDGWSRNMFIGLIQRFGLETDIAKHLSTNYGDRAWTVCEFAKPTEKNWPLHGVRLHNSYPFIEAEIHYALKHEYALTPIDILGRRTRLAFLNAHAALEALPRVIEIMGDELNWSYTQRRHKTEQTVRWLAVMGLGVGGQTRGLGSVDGHGQTREMRMREVEKEFGVSLDPRVSGMKGKMERVMWKVGEVVLSPGYLVGLVGGLVSGAAATVGFGVGGVAGGGGGRAHVVSRSKFELGEVAVLREAFEKRAAVPLSTSLSPPSPSPSTSSPSPSSTPSSSSSQDTQPDPNLPLFLPTSKILDLLKEDISGFGYEQVSGKDLKYVLDEVGVHGDLVDFDEFVEICGNLKDVALVPPAARSSKSQQQGAGKVGRSRRGVIPVEKSGGGV